MGLATSKNLRVNQGFVVIMTKNIFTVLAKCNSANDENYLTEAFVYILQSLYESDRDIFLKIIKRICVKGNEYNFLSDEKISITTQESNELGRPDIKITTPDKLIYIEVKHDSPLGCAQIERYLQILDSSSSPIKKLILLTRFSIEFTEQQVRPYKNIRWFEIYNWLSNMKPTSIVNEYLVLSFLKFLEEKQMSVEKVTWEYMNGVPALKILMNMIAVAIESTSLKIASKSAGWDWMGYYIENKNYFCCIYYDSPLTLKFEVYKDKKTIKVFALDFEKVCFFSLDKDRQLAEIVNFINNCYNESKSLI